MSTQGFFKECTEQSRIETRIVSKDVSAWAQVMVSAIKKWKRNRIAFIGLFDGPGSYEGKVPSTPVRVLGAATKNPTLKEMLVAISSDADPRHVHSLEEAIASFSGLYEVSNALPVLANR